MRRMRNDAIHAEQWRRRVVGFDRDQRRPRWFVLRFVACYVAFWVAIALACLFDLVGMDGHERDAEPIRNFVYQALRSRPLGVSFAVALATTILVWKFVSPGPRREPATS